MTASMSVTASTYRLRRRWRAPPGAPVRSRPRRRRRRIELRGRPGGDDGAGQRADELGFDRFWVAEHHNFPTIASTSPPVLMAHLAASTSRIRIGSGGVMLPNHPPLVVAEQFALLEALHPGRIDLGIGRAPGTDPATAAALRRSPHGLGAEDFPNELLDLMGLLGDRRRERGIWDRFRATPELTSSPEIVLLGSSGYSAQLAGMLGLPYAFAHHFDVGSSISTLDAVAAVSPIVPPVARALDEPYTIVTAGVLAAETVERAEYLAAPARLAMLALRTGRRLDVGLAGGGRASIPIWRRRRRCRRTASSATPTSSPNASPPSPSERRPTR